MRNAVVTGASSGIGLALCRYLLENDYQVYGVARRFDTCDLKSPNFKQCRCDITQPDQIEKLCRDVKSQHNDELHLLINNAGMAAFGPYETLKPDQIIRMVDTNLKAPLLFTNQLLRALKTTGGTIINIASVTAELISPWGNAYAATKAGLLHFGNVLFDEIRKSGVKVVTILPDLTDTPFYDDLDFLPHDNPQTHLKTSDITEVVKLVLEQREGVVVNQITIRPQKFQITRK